MPATSMRTLKLIAKVSLLSSWRISSFSSRANATSPFLLRFWCNRAKGRQQQPWLGQSIAGVTFRVTLSLPLCPARQIIRWSLSRAGRRARITWVCNFIPTLITILSAEVLEYKDVDASVKISSPPEYCFYDRDVHEPAIVVVEDGNVDAWVLRLH